MLAKNTLIVNMQPEKDSNIAVYIPSHKSCNKFIQTYLTRAYRGVGTLVMSLIIVVFVNLLCFFFLCMLFVFIRYSPTHFQQDIHPHISYKPRTTLL